MGYQRLHSKPTGSVWKLAERQHGVVTRGQLLALGLSTQAIKHRLATGRLHPLRRGVYAVGHPRLTRYGRWMAAVLCCGQDAVLSHASAAALWGLEDEAPGPVEISVPRHAFRRRAGIRIHRRRLAEDDVTERARIPVTTPACTLVDMAPRLDPGRLVATVNEADKRNLTDPEALRSALEGMRGRRGVATLRRVLDRHTFTLTDSELERRFLPLAREAGLPPPKTQCMVNGFKVDFYWPELGIVVETDGLTYHRTPAAQTRDRLRDQAHAAAGLVPLRFSHAQISFRPGHVRRTLRAVARRQREAR